MGVLTQLTQKLETRQQRDAKTKEAFVAAILYAAEHDKIPDGLDTILEAAGKDLKDFRQAVSLVQPIYNSQSGPQVRKLQQHIDDTKTTRWREARASLDSLASQASDLRSTAEGKELDIIQHRFQLRELGISQAELGGTFGVGPEYRNHRSIRMDRARCTQEIRTREYQLKTLPQAGAVPRWEYELSQFQSLLGRIQVAEKKLADIETEREEPARILVEEQEVLEHRKRDPEYLARLLLKSV